MSDEQQALIRQGEQLPERPAQVGPSDVLSAVLTIAKDPGVSIEVAERLIAMHERLSAKQAEEAFHAAMARLQAKIPQINKAGQGKNSKFAKLEDIDVIIRPLLFEEGFSLAFDEESHTEKTVTFVAKLSRSGHSEVKRLTVPIDAAAKNREGISIRPAIQDAGSTVSYARRYLLKMHLNIIEINEDTDGEPTKTITDEQAKDIEAMLQEVKGDRAGFLKYMGVQRIEDILERDHRKAIESLQAKRRSMK